MSSDQARRAAMAAAQVAAQGGATSGNASVTAVDGDDNSVATGGSRGGLRGVGGDLTSGGEDNSDAGIAGSRSAAGQPDAALISAHVQRSTPAPLPGQVPGSDAGSDGESTEFWDVSARAQHGLCAPLSRSSAVGRRVTGASVSLGWRMGVVTIREWI